MKFTPAPLALLIALSFTPALHADSLTTTFGGGNNFTGNMFNVSVGSSALNITGLDVNVDSGSMIIDVYIKNGTYVGSETNAAAWTLVSATSISGLGEGLATDALINPFTLAANASYGIYVTVDANTNAPPYMYYTNGDNTYANSALTLSAGAAEGGKFGSLGVFDGRTWNGTIDYSTAPATITPEPGTLLLSASGLSSLLFACRRRLLRT